ncbi:hypothetical protein SAMN05421637_0785 [Demequina mangrovi]|uniref:Uncharacterized protein n=1 Tax=Demequina mangrovi TaxID=1043493 RepID=A0A1H6W8Q1_9MICO|nr:hypothetical protein SAMN05421637_0785 [Demequina mangrovi]
MSRQDAGTMPRASAYLPPQTSMETSAGMP